MPFENHLWTRRLKEVEKEYLATKFATQIFLERARPDSTILPANLRLSEFRRSSENQEGTYVVRMFSEFETGLRTFWRDIRNKKTHPPVSDLIRSISSSCRIAVPPVDNVDRVRRFRNFLVHERDATFEHISLEVARSHLCVFLARLI